MSFNVCILSINSKCHLSVPDDDLNNSNSDCSSSDYSSLGTHTPECRRCSRLCTKSPECLVWVPRTTGVSSYLSINQ